MKRILSRILILLLLIMALTACGSEETTGLQDGYYTNSQVPARIRANDEGK